MYKFDERLVQVWHEENLIVLLNHIWREKDEIYRYGFKLLYQEVSCEQLVYLRQLNVANTEEQQNELIEKIGSKKFTKLKKYKFVITECADQLIKSIWHSQAAEHLYKYLKSMYNIEYPKAPTRVLFLPTLRCFGDCIFCITNSKARNDMNELTLEEWGTITDRVINEVNPCMIDIIGGEPLVRSDVSLEIARKMTEAGKLVKLVTNGKVLCDYNHVLKWKEVFTGHKHNIQLSLDGSKEVHNTIRPGVSFDDVWTAIENVNKAGLTYGVNLTINKYNFEEFDKIVRQLNELNPRYVMISPLQISNKDVGLCKDIMLTTDQENQLRKRVEEINLDFPQITIKYDKPDDYFGDEYITNEKESAEKHHKCTGFYEEMSIAPNGMVMPCLRASAHRELWTKEHIQDTENILDIWNDADIANTFRSISLSSECLNCKYTMKCTKGCPLENYVLNGELGGLNPHCELLKREEVR